MHNLSAWNQLAESAEPLILVRRFGDDAAAAGTLKLFARRKDMKDIALTKDYFERYSQQRLTKAAAPAPEAAELQTVDSLNQDSANANHSSPAPPDWELYFSASKHRIARAAGGWTGHFNLDQMRQGPTGDCFFIASLGSLLLQRPEQLKLLITPLPDGTYRANFPGLTPFIVKSPTDAELAISSVSADDGCWLAVMEQAFGRYRMLKLGIDAAIDATDVIGHGGQTGPTIDALTGNSHKRISVAVSIEQRKAQAGKILPELRDKLLATINEHLVITVSVIPPSVDSAGKITGGKDHGTAPHIPAGITRHHAYAIISYDRRSDLIGLWNPHGQNFTPKGTPGLENGYSTVHGRFTLPLTDAYCFCNDFTFETPKRSASASSGRK